MKIAFALILSLLTSAAYASPPAILGDSATKGPIVLQIVRSENGYQFVSGAKKPSVQIAVIARPDQWAYDVEIRLTGAKEYIFQDQKISKHLYKKLLVINKTASPRCPVIYKFKRDTLKFLRAEATCRQF